MSYVCPPPESSREVGFLRALDAAVVHGLVQHHLRTDGSRLQLVPDYVRWKEQDGSIVGWRAADDGSDGCYVTLRTARPDRLADEAEKIGHRMDEEKDGMRLCAVVPEYDLLLVAFPLDRQLSDLRRMVRLGKVRALLDEHCRDLLPPGHRISRSRSSMQLVRYKPERRAVIRWDLGTADEGGRTGGTRTVWVRILAEPLPQRQQVVDAANEGCVAVPPVLARPHDRLQGSPWSLGAADAIPAVAGVLARLHRCRVPAGSAAHGTVAELDLVLEAVEVHRRLGADQGLLASAVADQLARTMPSNGRVVLLHGDFHCGQVLVNGSVALCDLDRAGAGPAVADLASLYAHAFLDGGAAGASFAADFVDACAGEGMQVMPRELAWWIAASLVRGALAPFRRLRPDWREEAVRILGEASRIAHGGTP
jgi:aminoglycoside phosphotransferase